MHYMFFNLIIYYYSFLAIAFLLSFLVIGKNDLFDNFQKNIIIRLLVGFLLIATITAIIYTEGRTIFLPVIPILIYYRNQIIPPPKRQTITTNSFLIIILFSLIPLLFSYFYISGDDIDNLKLISLDQSFYASLSEIVKTSGIESTVSIIKPFEFLKSPVPYHYFENWISVFIMILYNTNSVLSMYGVLLPACLFVTILGVYSLIDLKENSSFFIKSFLIIISLFFIFLRGYYYGKEHINSIFFEGNMKFVYLFPFFLMTLLFLKDNKLQLSFFSLLLIPILNIVFLPHVAMLCFFIIIYFSSQIKNKSFLNQENKSILINLLGYLLLFTFYLFFLADNSNTSNTEIVKSFGGIYYSIMNDIKGFMLSKFIFIVIFIYLIITKKLDPAEFKVILFSFFFLFSASLSGSILNNNQNSYQIFLSADIIVTLIFFLVSIWYFSRTNKVIFGFILIVIFISEFVFLKKDFMKNSAFLLFDKNYSYDKNYLDSIRHFNFKNKVGIKVVDASQRIMTRRNPAYCGASVYMPYLDNILYSIVVNPHTLLPPNDGSFINNIRNKEFISSSFFLKECISNDNTVNSVKYESSIKLFIYKFKPEFCILEGNAEIPSYIKSFIINDSELKTNNERFYLLKYYE
jgi:hypothetical protein